MTNAVIPFQDIEDLFERLLLDEDTEDYHLLFEMIDRELQPQNCIEKFWIQDLVRARWEIFQSQVDKNEIVSANKERALESLLVKIILSASPVNADTYARVQARKYMEAYREGEDGEAFVRSLLARNNFSEATVKAEAFAMSSALIEALDRRISLLQRRKILLLRELGIRREFARRAAPFLDDKIPPESTPVIEPKKTE